MWELVHSQHVIDNQRGEVAFGKWRRQAKQVRPGRWRPLLTLAPAWGYTPDFLTPAEGSTEVDAGIERVRSTPREVLRRDLDQLAGGRAVPRWVGDLAMGEVAPLRALTGLMRSYFDELLAPYWPRMQRSVDEELHRLAQVMAYGGADALLDAVSPTMRWDSPVLHLATKSGEHDMHLEGEGVVLQPSFFAVDDVTPMQVPGMPLVLAYPVRPELGWCTEDETSTKQSLPHLLGRTRANALEQVAGSPCTTSQLAQSLGVSPASASHAAKVLREAGLVTSAQHGKQVVHRATALGTQLLEGVVRI